MESEEVAPRLHLPDGPEDAKILVIGERPGYEEHRALDAGYDTVNFIGPAGEELWDRLNRLALITRDECRVMNLVPTFSTKPPTAAEIALHGWRVVREIRRLRPALVITVGYHAARFLLPQYRGVNGDYFHGLAHSVRVGRLRPVRVTVVPVVHSSAALRQPGKFQLQLTEDLKAVRDVWRGTAQPEELHDLAVYRSGLAAIGGAPIGIDTEHGNGEVEAITVSVAHRLDDFYEAALYEPKGTLPHPWQVLCSSKKLVAHSASAEYHSLVKLGVERWDHPIDDTMIMAYVLGRPHLSLKVLAARELRLRMQSYDDVVDPVDDLRVRDFLAALSARLAPRAEKPKKGKMTERTKRARRALTSIKKLMEVEHEDKTRRERWNDSVLSDRYEIPPRATWKDAEVSVREPYAMGDAVVCRQLRDHLWSQVQSEGLTRAYSLQRDVLPSLVRNEVVGLLVDGKALRELSRVFGREFEEVRREIDRLAGHPVNPLSGDQVSECLFNELGIRPTRLTKSQKAHTTADKYLKARRKEHEIIPLILDARLLNKYKSTYTDKIPDMLVDGRFHPEWIDCGTATGRLAEKILLLIPKHSKRATLIRNCFHADDGHRLISVDLSQIELRMMAHLSRDKKMLGVFERGEDMHADTAENLLGAPKGKENQDESLHRLPAKTMNFGIINGMTEYGMLDQLHEAGQLHWDVEQVREFRKDWFRVYSGVDQFWQQQIAKGRHYGYVVTMFGRKRYLHGLRSTSEQVRVESERQALCSIQSSADDISKLWNIRIWRRILRPAHREGWYCEPWIRVHDDTTLEVKTKRGVDVAKRMLELVPQLLDIPTTAEAKWGERWGDLQKLPKG